MLWLFLILLVMPAGCSGRSRAEAENRGEEETQEEPEEALLEDAGLYILLYCNTDTEHIFVECVDNGRQEEFEYNGGTYIRDRYGSSRTVEQLSTGELIHIRYNDKKVLSEIQIAEETFENDSVTSFHIDPEEEIITVADSKYYYDEFLKIFSGNGIISLNELSEADTLCIRGFEKKVLTVVVTRGHGTVAFKNVGVFEGGMVSIGNVAAREITTDLVIEVPEGTYTLSAANEGYGGNMEITVNRFEELMVDLNVIKGEGPSYCSLILSVTPEDAEVTLDGNPVDCSRPLELKYGAYRLIAKASGYEDWVKRLVVNSEEAEIIIALEEEAEEDEDDKSESEEKDADDDTDKTDE